MPCEQLQQPIRCGQQQREAPGEDKEKRLAEEESTKVRESVTSQRCGHASRRRQPPSILGLSEYIHNFSHEKGGAHGYFYAIRRTITPGDGGSIYEFTSNRIHWVKEIQKAILMVETDSAMSSRKRDSNRS